MTTANSIEHRNYVATPQDIERIAGTILDSTQAADSGRGTYLKALVATTQAELGSQPRKRPSHSTHLDENGVAAQLAAFEAVYARFHEAVVKVAEATVPDPNAALMRSRTAFSRSAGSTVRSFIRAGNDIRSLVAAKVIKKALAVPRARRKFTVEALRKRAVKLTEELAAVLRNLKAANSEIALEAAQPALASIATISGVTSNPVRDVQKALEGNVTLVTRTGTFIPLDLAAYRAAKKAA